MRKNLVLVAKFIFLLIILGGASYGLVSTTFLINKEGDFLKNLPNPSFILKKDLPLSTFIYDRQGNLIYEIYGQQRRYLASSIEIPELTKNAFVAIEDRNFWHHSGISFISILRAIKNNFRNPEKIQGGSTITQQLIKNSVLGNENSLSRKIKEAILAFRLEKIATKDEIIARYLNEVSFGGNIYGIKTAAKIFFNKDLKDLTLAENALLAAIPEAPSYYYPYGPNKKELLKRKDLVLKKMAEEGYIKNIEYEYALKQPIVFTENKKIIKFPYFSIYVRDKLFEMYGEDNVRNGGFKVITTIDPQKQKIAEEVINKNINYLLEHRATNVALLAVNPENGQILAMVGGIDYNSSKVNVVFSLRQPGSSFKPIVYLTAFEKGYAPDTLILDYTRDFGGGYIPQNFDGINHGWVPLKKALGNSYNVSAVKTIEKVGVKPVIKKAKELGIKDLNEEYDYGYALALGSASVKLFDMVQVYSVFSQDGEKIDLTPFILIKDKNDTEIVNFSRNFKKERVADAQLVQALNGILSDNNNRINVFGWYNDLVLSREAAAKTGTTNDYRDALTIGYTPNLVCGVWVGNNDNRPMDKVAGALGAAPIWHDFMEEALKDMPLKEFKKYQLKTKDVKYNFIY